MRRISHLAVALAPMVMVDSAAACSTCFGDPESGMAKGAVMGVYVMIGVIGCVLAGFTGAGIFWIQRARRMVRDSAQAGSSERP